MSGYLLMTTVAAGSVLLFLPAWAWARRRRRRAAAKGGTAAPPASTGLRVEQRLEAVEGRLGELAARQAGGASEEKLQAMAGSLVALVRDKNAAMDTALAGLDQLRARMRALEQMGDVAETRGLFDGLGARIDAAQAAQAASEAAIGARLAALEASDPGGALAGQFARLMEHKDAAIATVLDRLGPLEARLDALRGAQADTAAALAARVAALEAADRDPRAAIDALAARLEASQAAHALRIAALEAPADNPFAEISDQLTRLYAQKDAAVETVLARLAPLEARLGEIDRGLAAADPRAALDRFAERLETLQARLAAVEAPGENPFAEISAQLTALYAQKDAAVETVLARLAPLEARLAAVEQGAAAKDPQAALDRFAERLETLQARLTAVEAPGESPFAEISTQLTALYAQKDAAVETVLARLAPLEARLGEIDRGLAAADPRAALDRFAERLEALQARLAAVEAPGESPFAEISEQLTRLYAQKDAGLETVLGHLAPLEARLAALEGAERDPRAALDAFALRLDGLQARLKDLETPGENPFAEISEQLTRLYAQKDATVQAVFARLAPLEARLGAIETAVESRDPRQALDGFATRLEAVKAAHEARLAALEMPGENPFAEISEQLTALYAQKDAAVETVLGRLAPLEARLASVEQGAAERDPRAALDRFAERLEALQARLVAVETPGENPFAEISEQLTRLYAQKDAAVETVLGRLAPLEARLGSIEAEIAPRVAALEAADPRAALAEIAARVAALQAAQGAAGERLEALQAAVGALPPFAEISDQLARLNAQKDAAVEAVAARLAPIEVRLAELEARPAPESAEQARAEAQEIAAQMIALRAAAAQTELFADRLALLEASLPRLSAAQALMLQALERQGARAPAAAAQAPVAEEPPAPAAEAPAMPAAAPGAIRADLPDLPRVVSLHHG